ncbi:MAG: fatty acid--CoA ligase [Prolixibacteraceae bacterium]|nr:fatty acid--CoA ligase [Prolixibacteraceae bacterium]
MSNLIERTTSAYSYPLIIKQLFQAPLVDNPAQEIVYRDQLTLTYQTWKERVNRLAGALTSLGIKAGDTVAVMEWDSHRYLEMYYAIPMLGAVLHMINVRLSPEQMVYTIEHAEDDVIICHADFLPLLEAIKGRIADGRKFILIKDNGEVNSQHIHFEGEYETMLAGASPEFDFPELDENTRATTFYTTGTTGLPKGVYFSHRQLVLHTLASLAALASPAHGRMHRDSVYMPITPMFHVHAWGIPYMATYMGIKQVYPGKYVPAMLMNLLLKHKVTFSHCVPTILNMLLKAPEAAQADLSNWTCIIGGAALPKAVALEALKRGIDVLGGYGLSETCPVLSISHLTSEELELPPEEQAQIRCRTGKPIGLAQIRVVNEQGKDVPQDDKTPGEIIVRSPYLTQGYLKDHVHSEKLWQNGWMHTNDVACVDAGGSIRITDRTKDIIKVGGEWLSSLEIEDVIGKHEHVDEVAVIGVPDVNWGEIPLAIVVKKLNTELNDREIIQLVKGSVDSGVLPREAMLLKVQKTGTIDKTSVGKINKRALRKKFAENPPLY